MSQELKVRIDINCIYSDLMDILLFLAFCLAFLFQVSFVEAILSDVNMMDNSSQNN